MRRNLIIIMSDEHDPRHSGAYGSTVVRTPHIDALAKRGARFNNAYTPCPICVPARAAFATGQRVHTTRLWDNAMPYHGQIKSWGHALQERGIRVESIGKLHYRAEGDHAGFDKEHIPMHVVGGYGMVWGSIRDPYLHRFEGKRMLGDVIGRGESSYTQYDAQVTTLAVDWLHNKNNTDTPFVLYLGFVAPHFPLLAPPQFFDLYKDLPAPHVKLHPKDGHARHPWAQDYAEFEGSEENFKSPAERTDAFRAYYGLVSYLDDNIGQVLKALSGAGLEGCTDVIYTADHGDNLGARALWGKTTLYEESARIPLILAGEGIAPTVCETPVDLLDLYPTILSRMGLVDSDQDFSRPGRALQSLAAEPYDAERVVFSEYHACGSNSAGFMVRKGRYKLLHYVRHAPELFDLQADPEELRNLADEPAYAAVLSKYQALLRSICDPEALDALAKSDQKHMIAGYGGLEVAAKMGAHAATPAPTAK